MFSVHNIEGGGVRRHSKTRNVKRASKVKRQSPKRRSPKRKSPTKKQLAALARGRKILAEKRAKDNRRSRRRQRGGGKGSRGLKQRAKEKLSEAGSVVKSAAQGSAKRVSGAAGMAAGKAKEVTKKAALAAMKLTGTGARMLVAALLGMEYPCPTCKECPPTPVCPTCGTGPNPGVQVSAPPQQQKQKQQ
jgi:hypothetical protein